MDDVNASSAEGNTLKYGQKIDPKNCISAGMNKKVREIVKSLAENVGKMTKVAGRSKDGNDVTRNVLESYFLRIVFG